MNFVNKGVGWLFVNEVAMDLIQNNPYRILGVYANSPTKERLANHNRMKAFLKVGKPVSFPLDLPQYLSSISRTQEAVAEAESSLTLPKDQLKYAQFWFIKVSPLDGVAFNNLLAGNISKAEDIWQKQECASSLQNRIVCALMRNDYDVAISCAETLYGNSQYVSQLASAVVGDTANADANELAFAFLDTLSEEIGVNKILPMITDDAWKSHLSAKAVQPLIDSIQSAIDVAKKSKGKGITARLQAGNTLMSTTREALSQLKKLLPPSDLQYQLIADKLGLEILQCAIDYYNGSEAADAARRAMKLQSYALRIVVGKMAKDRCKENVDILQKIIDELPPAEVFAECKAIINALRNYASLPDKISHAITLLKKTKRHLQTIKQKLGESNSYYLKLSTIVVNNALGNVIAEVNEAQEAAESTANNHIIPRAAASMAALVIRPVLEQAWEATMLMDTFDMESDYKNNRYNENRTALEGLCRQFGVRTFSDSQITIPGLSGMTSNFSNSSRRTPPPVKRPTTSSNNNRVEEERKVNPVVAVLIIHCIWGLFGIGDGHSEPLLGFLGAAVAGLAGWIIPINYLGYYAIEWIYKKLNQ